MCDRFRVASLSWTPQAPVLVRVKKDCGDTEVVRDKLRSAEWSLKRIAWGCRPASKALTYTQLYFALSAPQVPLKCHSRATHVPLTCHSSATQVRFAPSTTQVPLKCSSHRVPLNCECFFLFLLVSSCFFFFLLLLSSSFFFFLLVSSRSFLLLPVPSGSFPLLPVSYRLF